MEMENHNTVRIVQENLQKQYNHSIEEFLPFLDSLSKVQSDSNYPSQTPKTRSITPS